MNRLIKNFFAEEMSLYLARFLLNEVRCSSSAVQYYTFNLYNLFIDRERGIVRVEDELDSGIEECLALSEFESQIVAWLERLQGSCY